MNLVELTSLKVNRNCKQNLVTEIFAYPSTITLRLFIFNLIELESNNLNLIREKATYFHFGNISFYRLACISFSTTSFFLLLVLTFFFSNLKIGIKDNGKILHFPD